MSSATATASRQAPIDDDDSLWARARALLPAAVAGSLGAALSGCHFCVLAEDPDTQDARLFDQAAAALGARVTHLSPERAGLAGLAGADDSAATGPLLARLYDAIECQGLSRDRVERLAASTSIPVFAGLVSLVRAPGRRMGSLPAGTDALGLLQACLVAACR